MRRQWLAGLMMGATLYGTTTSAVLSDDSLPQPHVASVAEHIPKRLYVPVDSRLGDIVSSHVQYILDCGYAEEVSDTDLFHLHVVVPNGGDHSHEQPMDEQEWIDVSTHPR